MTNAAIAKRRIKKVTLTGRRCGLLANRPSLTIHHRTVDVTEKPGVNLHSSWRGMIEATRLQCGCNMLQLVGIVILTRQRPGTPGLPED